MPAFGTTLNARETSTVHLHCGPLASLEDPRVRDTVVAAAHGIAERTGVVLNDIVVDHPTQLSITVEGSEVLGLGLVAELRRDTDRWYRSRTGTALWIGPDQEEIP